MIEITSEWMALLVHLGLSSTLVGAIVLFDRVCSPVEGPLFEEETNG